MGAARAVPILRRRKQAGLVPGREGWSWQQRALCASPHLALAGKLEQMQLGLVCNNLMNIQSRRLQLHRGRGGQRCEGKHREHFPRLTSISVFVMLSRVGCRRRHEKHILFSLREMSFPFAAAAAVTVLAAAAGAESRAGAEDGGRPAALSSAPPALCWHTRAAPARVSSGRLATCS